MVSRYHGQSTCLLCWQLLSLKLFILLVHVKSFAPSSGNNHRCRGLNPMSDSTTIISLSRDKKSVAKKPAFIFSSSLSGVMKPSSHLRIISGADNNSRRRTIVLYSNAESGIPDSKSSPDENDKKKEQEEKEKIGNLVADDEWVGLSYELSELVRTAVVEDMKKNAREFLGKDEYKIGDISKEIDSRVKDEVANLRNKDEYELGDLIIAMDEMSKNMTEDLTGKPYEFGDLSKEIDRRIKVKVVEFCTEGDATNAKAEDYEFGDLSREIDRRVKVRVEEFTGKSDYEFGDISKEINERRKKWMQDYLGEQYNLEDYQFGDITKKAVSDFTGKEKYQFGDITKKVMGNVFGPRKNKKTTNKAIESSTTAATDDESKKQDKD